jgi:hypothetical protein
LVEINETDTFGSRENLLNSSEVGELKLKEQQDERQDLLIIQTVFERKGKQGSKCAEKNESSSSGEMVRF